jgi:hypothetical protein
VAVVAVLRKGSLEGVGSPIPEKGRLLLWSLTLLDVMTVAWMLSAGDWLDRSSPLTAVVTLGGHHIVVLWLAVAAFATLATLMLLTKALTETRRLHLPFVMLGALASAVALGGVLSIAILVVGVVALVALAGFALFGNRLVFLGSLFRRR